jgi:branched-chain amino acid aminotransferase
MQQTYNPANANIQIWVGDRLWHRSEAKVSVFDSVVQGGDAVWEGLRVYNGRIFAFDDHVRRLQDSAHALMFAAIPDAAFIRRAVMETLQANEMRNGAHIRLTLTRGEKITSGMDPRLNQQGCTLIVLAEWKAPVYGNQPVSLITASVRRNSPMHLDSKIHHNNLLNNILAKIEANIAGADDALMLDNLGFVAETNACNIFLVKDGIVLTPHAHACLPGITRKKVLQLAAQHSFPCLEKNISLTEMYTADEVFTTGTMGELVAVCRIDGREIINKSGQEVLMHLQKAYAEWTQTSGEKLDF